MSDWDASEDESGPTTSAPAVPVVPKKSSKWADEDADDEVVDDWEADSDSESRGAPKADAAPKPIRNKGVTRQKIAEKEAQEAQERAAAEARAEEEADPVARKAREQKRTLDADMENARGLFGEASISNDAAKEKPWEMNPRTKEQFDEMAAALSDYLFKHQGSKPLYPTFLEAFAKHLASPLSDVQTRKVASALTALANEKQRAAKDAAGGKKGAKGKAKPSLGGVGGSASVANKGGRGIGADLESYDDAIDDDLDFM